MNVQYWLVNRKQNLLLTVKTAPDDEIIYGPYVGKMVNGKPFPPKEAISQKNAVKEAQPDVFKNLKRVYKMSRKATPATSIIETSNGMKITVKKPKVKTALAVFVEA